MDKANTMHILNAGNDHETGSCQTILGSTLVERLKSLTCEALYELGCCLVREFT